MFLFTALACWPAVAQPQTATAAPEAAPAQAESALAGLPPGTALPVLLSSGLQAGKTRPGTAVVARTLQAIEAGGKLIAPRGARLEGHVVVSQALPEEGAPGVSRLAVRFDRLDVPGAKLVVTLELRALAAPVTTTDARTPHFYDEKDDVGRVDLVGGASYLRNDPRVVAPTGEVVGLHLDQEVFAKLRPGAPDAQGAAALHCEAGAQEQSLAIFSPWACGMYGYPELNSAAPGAASLALTSAQEDVKLYAYSALLLIAVPAVPAVPAAAQAAP